MNKKQKLQKATELYLNSVSETSEVLEIGENSVEYDVFSFDGYALGKLKNKRDKAPQYILMKYKCLDRLAKADKEKCLEYRGLPSNEEVTYSDVCICMGKVIGKFTKSEVELLAKKRMKGLTKKQQKLVREMWLDGYECGFLENDWDELIAFIEECGEFEGVEDFAADYYFSMCA